LSADQRVLQMTATQAMHAASLTPAHSPAARLAQELCLLVGVDPNAYGARAGALVQGASIPNWQFVIAEQLIGSALRISLRGGPLGNGG
jgi:hypothetical protein